MDQDAQRGLRSSFGSVAASYAEHRPTYATDAVRWALEHAPGTQVLDLGAGTGKLSGVLAALGAEVVAVEPDPAMLDELRAALPMVRALLGSAESVPLPDASIDAVVAGNALHWFDMEVAGPEIARVLRPGGVLAGLWNAVDDEVDWVAGLEGVAGPAVLGPRDTRRRWRSATARLVRTGRGEHFDAPEQAEFPHQQERTADTLVETLATRAGVLVMPEDERRDTVARLRTYLASRPETRSCTFPLPMLTGVLRVRRGDLQGRLDAEG